MHNRVMIVAVFFLSLVSLTPAYAQSVPTGPIAKAMLLVDAPHVKKDQPIAAAIAFTLPKGWHVYWQNPGDSGLPTTLAWTLPDGLTAGDVHWPVPERFDLSGIVNYGYAEKITLPIPLTPSRDGITGDITVKANWLVCSDTCIPESATLTAPLAPNAAAAKEIIAANKLVPQPLQHADIHYEVSDGLVEVAVPYTAVTNAEAITNADFFPIDDGIIRNNAAPQFVNDSANGLLKISAPRGSAELTDTFDGVLVLHGGRQTLAYQIAAVKSGFTPASQAPGSPTAASAVSVTLLVALALAFLGGLILNIMPCVLPILALKALSIAKKSQSSRAAAAKQGVAYTAGVIVSFLAIAGVMLGLKASGAAIGWGFQLQNTGFVALLAVVMLLVAANLLGWFELPVLFGSKATGVDDTTLRGAFLTGGLAVMVATPCSAPFMATAIGATLAMPTPQALLVFATLGLGMAAPFLLISLSPRALRLIPKPGVWMVRFKQWLALPMIATAVWLVNVIVQMQHGPMQADGARVMYTPERLEQLRRDGLPVLVDVTAAWCITCKVNEQVALKPESMQQFFRDQRVILMVADWTNNDPVITQYLAGFGRNGVPLYVYYPPQAEPVVLPQILTPSLVRATITQGKVTR